MLCLALAFACGIAGRLFPQTWWLFAGGVGLFVAFALYTRHGCRWCLALMLCAGLGVARLELAQRLRHGDYRRCLRHPKCFATLKLVIHDAPLLEGSLARLDAGRGALSGRILAIQTIWDDEFHFATGIVSLSPKYEIRQAMRNLRPGTGVLAQGVLIPLEKDTPLDGRREGYLRSRGFFHQFEVDSFETIDGPPPGGLFRMKLWLRSIRVKVAERLVRNVESESAAQLLLALGLGMGEFTPRETRERQLVSGTLHAFAISGMHIGMAALLFAWLLRWSGLSVMGQRIALGGLVVSYVLLTGSSISSLRALWMALLAIYATLRNRRAAWLNALGCAAFLALAANPWQLLDLGFLYSHVTVMALLLAAPAIRCQAQLLGERDEWLPRHLRHRRLTALKQWFYGGAMASALAWAGTLGISMHNNSRLSCGAFLLNLPLGLLVASVLALCPLRLLLGVLFPAGDHCWASCLAGVMRLAEAVAESGYASAFEFTLPMWPGWGVVIYYLIFFPLIIYIYLTIPRE